MTVCRANARTGMPARLLGARKRRAGMSSPMVCTMRGPAKTIELMVETSRAAMTPPITRPPNGPNNDVAATKPTSSCPFSPASGVERRNT